MTRRILTLKFPTAGQQPSRTATVDHVGKAFRTITITRRGYHGTWFGTCAKCEIESLFTPVMFRKNTVACPKGCSS